ncbi:MarR family transcriptional regulator [Methylomonas sp. EFPC1]|uniref:MarR family winged helix-turn-helix transcriptional regulator n=1 Tax=Methylomonas sp. EFPC1 TaxID=2812647 RepID=UPI001967E347|nr:MarR family transcriptional regulator [Methylomonas sp. EFPC1]QSB01361.1 MarR family transcriptional regulator [Methylomonas sp. EFPC1]
MVDQIAAIDTPPIDEMPTPERREAALRLAIEQFYFGYRAFTIQPDRILAERGLGRVHHRILYFVGRNPRISVNALLGMLSVSKQALNAPLRQLMDMQLVMIDTAAHDKRVRELSLTPDGAELEAQLTGTQMQQLQTVFAQVGAEAEAGWHEVMRSLSAQG